MFGIKILAGTVLHACFTFALQLTEFTIGLSRFDSREPLSLLEVCLLLAEGLFSFPVVAFADQLGLSEGYSVYFLNGLVWMLAISASCYFIRRRGLRT